MSEKGKQVMVNASEKFNQMTDEEIETWVSQHMTGQGAHLALSILMCRSVKEVKEAIKEFDNNSEKYSERIVRLTWVLVVLSVFIAILTVIMALK